MILHDHQGRPVRSDRVAVNGTSLHVRTAGYGPALLLLHGIPKTSAHWHRVLPALSAHFTVVAPDLRGTGDSAHPATGYDSVTMSEDVAALMETLGHESYAVVGEDWGAVVGYHVAARHRDRVRALVMAEAFLPGFGFEDHSAITSPWFLWHLGFYFQPDVPEMLIAGHEAELIRHMVTTERRFPETATPEILEEYVRCYGAPGGIRSMLEVYRAMLVDGDDVRAAARRALEIPVLSLGGDAAIAGDNEIAARRVATDVTAHVLEAGHDLAEEVPDQFVEAVLPFLTGPGAAA